ncbi:MAG TPA: hypothetical protein DEO57_05415 [Phycisphaerales bacterium]|nr:hypothetical protein [Phycisphaerales bacterium]
MAKSKKRKKKKQKLNVKMIALIASSALVLAIVVGGLVTYQYVARNSRNIRAGDQAFAEGKFNQARKYYGRVVYREPDNAAVIEKLLAAYDNIVPLTIEEAREFYGEKQAALMQRAKNTGVREENYLDMAANAYRAARLTNGTVFWGRLQDVAKEMVLPGRFAKDSDAYAMGKLYLGLCQIRLRDGEMTENIDIDGNIKFPGEAELLEHLALRPDSDEGLAGLAFGRLAVARKLGLEGRFGQEQKNLVIAEGAFQNALERSPDGPAVALMVLRDLYIRKVIQNGDIQSDSASVTLEEIEALDRRMQAALDHAESIIAADPVAHEAKLFELLSFISQVDRDNGHARAVVLLEDYLATRPDDDRMRIMLAQSHRSTGDYDAARRNAQLIIDAEQKPISLEAMEQFGMRANAANLLFDVEYERWVGESGEDVEVEGLQLERVLEARKQLDRFLGGNTENVVALNADARIAMGQSRYRDAARLFEQQIFIDGNPTADTLRAAAFSLEKSGQSGLALERMEQAIARDPMSLRHYLAKAKLEGRMGRPMQGIATLESLPPSLQADNDEVRTLKDSLRMLVRGDEFDPSQITDESLRVVRTADAMIRKGQYDEARLVLEAALEAGASSDYRVMGAYAQTLAMLGEFERANEMIDKALEMKPGSPLLASIRDICRNTSPIDRVRMEIEQQELSPDEAKVNLYVSMRTLAAQQEASAVRLDRSRLSDQAGEARAFAVEANEAADAIETEIASFPVESYPALFEYRFQESMDSGDWEFANELVELSKEHNLDEAGGHLTKARYHRERSSFLREEGDAAGTRAELVNAAESARSATEVSAWSDMTWSMLARMLDELGNQEEAMEAYEEAYRRNPGRQSTVLNYSRRLLDPTTGEPLRALRILREARDLYIGNPLIEDAWMQAEEQVGDKSVVLVRRSQLHDRKPGDRSNAIRLASLLANLEPDYTYIFDSGYEPMTLRQWNAMPSDRQTMALRELKAAWTEKIDALLVGINEYEDRDMMEAMQHARVYDDLKRPDDAVRVVRGYLESREAVEIEEVLVAAQFFIGLDRVMEAAELLLASRRFQNDDSREVDYALGMMHYNSGTIRQCIPYFRSVLEARSSELVEDRLVQALVRTQKFQEARQILEGIQSDVGMNYRTYMLTAILEKARVDAAIAVGDSEVEAEARKQYLSYLEQANVLDPERLTPYISLADSLLEDYSMRREPALLDQALAVVSRGIDRLPESASLVAKRADILEARGDLNAAIMDLEQMSRKYPDSVPIRERLILAYLKTDSLEKAQAAITDGIALMPGEGTWFEALGDYYSSIPTPNIGLATEAYLNAYRRDPSRALLFKINGVTRTASDWDFDAMIDLFQQPQFGVANDPMTIGLYARSLAGKGAYDRAATQLRKEFGILANQIRVGSVHPSMATRWYDDLYVVFAARDGRLGEELAMEMAGPDLDYWNKAGLAQYWSLRGGKSDLDRAIELQKEVVEMARELGEVELGMSYSNLGSFQIGRGLEDESLETFMRLVELQPENAVALNNYAYVLATSMNKPEEALEYAVKAVRLDSSSLQILDTMATIYQMLGRHEDSLSSRLRLHQLYPADLNTLLAICDSYQRHMEDPAKAAEFAKLAMRVKPEDPRVLDAMGWATYRTGNVMEGEDFIRKSIRLAPTASAHVHLAQVFMSRSELGKASEQLRLAEDLAPDTETKAEIDRLKDDIARS